ncbi:MAG: phytoene/squalene synthase family protein [Bacteroidetes bacterium]|nr:phytoene/squalene synthase family protein [Bacteroidota bacterium]
MIELFHQSSEACSRQFTRRYSTSFSSAIRLLHSDLRQAVCDIYGFVRLSDEIVDTFHHLDKSSLLASMKEDTFSSIERGLSLNPIVHSFQKTVNKYNIDPHLIHAFFRSMEFDLKKTRYNDAEYKEYIYGSAEVVGLMCLHVFCEGDRELYKRLEASARSLGAALQKVNFLRDIKADYNGLSRVYFPDCDFSNFTESDKRRIEADIQSDFDHAYAGIKELPLKARFGVYVAYKYYLSLFKKIRLTEPQEILDSRIRIPNYHKALIVLRAGVKNQLRLI